MFRGLSVCLSVFSFSVYLSIRILVPSIFLSVGSVCVYGIMGFTRLPVNYSMSQVLKCLGLIIVKGKASPYPPGMSKKIDIMQQQ